MRSFVAFGLGLLIALACRDAGDAPAAVQRDSAGIDIIENPDPETADSSTWVVDTVPFLVIGSLDGPEEHTFGRMAGFTRLSDGRIAIADAQTNRVSFFDSTGKFLGRTTGRGSGPAEFVNLNGLLRYPGDSLLVRDHEGGRLTLIDPYGVHVRRFRPQILSSRPPFKAGAPSLHGVFADGTLLLLDYRGASKQCGPEETMCEERAWFARVNSAGTVVAELGPLTTERSNLARRTSGPYVAWAVHGTRFYYADASTFEIRVFVGDSLTRIVRAKHEGARLAADLEGGSAHLGIEVDAVGNLWVRQHDPEWLRHPATFRSLWFVFDSSGALIHSVRFPPGVYQMRNAFEIGNDYVLGTGFDSLGVESARMYRLRKAALRNR